MNSNKRYGLIGTNIQHSLSPVLWEAAYNGKQGNYELIDKQRIIDAIEAIHNFDGINVTKPFKESFLDLCNYTSREVNSIGATNCIKIEHEDVIEDGMDFENTAEKNATKPSIWLANNSDCFAIYCISYMHSFGYSMLMDLFKRNKTIRSIASEIKKTISDKNNEKRKIATVIGCGGTGKSAIYAMINMGYSVSVFNRTPEKAIQLARKHPSILPIIDLQKLKLEIDCSNIVIYTFPDNNPEIVKMIADKSKLVIEANYKNPALKKYENVIDYCDGKIWLLFQAYAGFELLTGAKPNFERMCNALNIQSK